MVAWTAKCAQEQRILREGLSKTEACRIKTRHQNKTGHYVVVFREERSEMLTDKGVLMQVRQRALELAVSDGTDSPEAIVKRAEVYAEFLEGGDFVGGQQDHQDS